jgi:HD-like signal output (HDOD) protein
MLAPASHSLEMAVDRIDELKVFPAAAVSIMRVSQSPDATLGDMVQAVAIDPVLAAKVLQVANSPFAGLRTRVTSLERAVHMLGIVGTRDVAIAALVGSIARTVAPWGPLLHRHALLTGHFARLLARYVPEVDDSEALVTGLLHDLGLQLLLAIEPTNTATLLEKFFARPQLLERAERVHFGFDHADLSVATVQRWELPEVVAEVIAGHHQPPVVGEVSRAHVVLQIADQLADAVADGARGDALLGLYRDHPMSSSLCIPGGVLRQVMARIDAVATDV